MIRAQEKNTVVELWNVHREWHCHQLPFAKTAHERCPRNLFAVTLCSPFQLARSIRSIRPWGPLLAYSCYAASCRIRKNPGMNEGDWRGLNMVKPILKHPHEFWWWSLFEKRSITTPTTPSACDALRSLGRPQQPQLWESSKKSTCEGSGCW